MEMREDVEALTVRLQEAGEQLCELKTRLVDIREAKERSPSGAAHKREGRNSRLDERVEEQRDEALGLSPCLG